MYEFMTKSIAKPGVTAKALHHIKKMYSTISNLTASDLSEGYYERQINNLYKMELYKVKIEERKTLKNLWDF